MSEEFKVSTFIQDELQKRNAPFVTAVDAARWLDAARILKDSTTRPGKPLRDLLRAEKIIGQRQDLNGRWYIDRVDSSEELYTVKPAVKEQSVAPGINETPSESSREVAMKRFSDARAKYRPSIVQYLLIAEAPPDLGSGRFFYFEDVSQKDSLFWETMKVLYPSDMPPSGYPRHRKREFLERFRSDGCYLLDAAEEPFESASTSFKIQRIRDSHPRLRDDLRRACQQGTKIILISATVFAACEAPLKENGFNVINSEMIDFPGNGCQKKFREKFGRVIGRSSGLGQT